jgi:hypothetical protein
MNASIDDETEEPIPYPHDLAEDEDLWERRRAPMTWRERAVWAVIIAIGLALLGWILYGVGLGIRTMWGWMT